MTGCTNISVSAVSPQCYLEIANCVSFGLLLYITLLLQIYLKCSTNKVLRDTLLPGHDRRCILSLLLLLVHLAEVGALVAGDDSWMSTITAAASWLPVQTFYSTVEKRGEAEYLVATVVGFLCCGLSRGVSLYSLLDTMPWDHVPPALAALSSALSYALAMNDFATMLVEMKRDRCKKIPSDLEEHQSYSHPESGWYSRITFYWLVPLLTSGFSCPLELQDLGRLPQQESVAAQLPRFLNAYNKVKSGSLWRAYFRCSWRNFLLSGMLKLVGDLIGMVPPLGIAVVITYVQTTPSSNEIQAVTWERFVSNGYVMAGIVLVSSLTQATFSQATTHILNVEGIRLKTALQGLIYSKSLKLSVSREEDNTTEARYSNVINLISDDVSNIVTCIWIGHYVWAIPLKIGVLMYLLYGKLGVSSLIGASCCILVMTPLQFYLGKSMSSNSKLITKWCDERLQKTNEMLQDFKVLKLSCWEMQFSERINESRNKELKVLDKESLYWALMTFLTHASSVLIAVVTLITHYYIDNHELSPANVFSALALFNQLTVPLFIFPITVPIIITAITSTKRLEEFLSMAEVSNVIPDFPSESNNNKERKFKIPSEDSVHKLGDILNTDELTANTGSCLVIRHAKFSWGDDSKLALSIDFLNIPISKLTAVIGKVGSGKSSLLSAILGEMKCVAGFMQWHRGVRVAYVSQQPWLLNSTIRDNILLGLPFNQKRFNRVITAAALQSDLDSFPARDLTEVGENGASLSGGQRQRVAIARALYSRANVLILDDPLSALDCNVAQHVFEDGIMKLVTKHNKTVIMVTHSLHLLTNAYQIIALEAGKVQACNRLCDIEVIDGVMTEIPTDIETRNKSVRERWQLVKLVSKIGHHIRQRESKSKMKPAFVPLAKRLSKRAEHYWREQLPLVEAVEGEVGSFRRGSRRHRQVARACSLQPHPSPHLAMVTRQASSPTINQPVRSRTYTFDGVTQGGNLLKQIFAPPNKPLRADYEFPNNNSIKEKSLLKRLISTSSIRSSAPEKHPIQRLPSTCSDCSDDFIDDDEEEDRDWYGSRMNDERQYGQIPIQIYSKYLLSCGLISSISYLSLSVLWQAVRVYTDFWLSDWTEGSDTFNKNEAMYYLVVYTSLSLVTVILSLLSNFLGQLCGARARRTLHKDLLNAVLRLSVVTFEALPHARILSRFSTDVGIIDKKLASSIQRLVQFLLLCLPAILVNCFITPWFLLIAIPICLIYYFIQKFYRSSSRELHRLESLSRTPIISHLNETISGLETIRAFKQQAKFTSTMFSKIDVHSNAFLIANSANRWLGISLDYLGAVIVALAMLVSIVCCRLMPEIVTPALVGVAANYTLLVPIYLNWVVKFLTDVEMNMSAVERIQFYTDLPPEDYRQKCIMYYGWPQKGEIKFKNVSIRYNIQHESVLCGFNLHIPPGQKVGICGRTGSGKSSLVMSLFGVAPVVDGAILIDDVDISKVPLCTLRSRISIIPQEVILYTGTIRENLDLCNYFSDNELWCALEMAQMKETVSLQLGGLDGAVREGGVNLSNGQRQLLCLARAVLHNSACLIMDEATSSLDTATEKTLLQVAYKAFSNRTVIMIAHRLTTLLSCDRILVLESGKIVEDGAPDDLLKRSMGIFSTMLRRSQNSGNGNVVS